MIRNQNLRRAVIAVAVYVVAYFGLGYIFGPAMFSRIMNGLTIAVSITVLIVYASVIGKALRTEIPDRVQLLTLGIATTWLAILLTRIRYTVTVIGEPESSELRSNFLTLILALFIVGGIQHIAATGKLEHSLPTIKLRVVATASAVGALVFGFYVGRFA